jgi:hypothetical protein
MKKSVSVFAVCFFAATTLMIAAQSNAGDFGLVDMLTQQLGVTTEQAEGGAGAIFGKAKDNMSSEEFDQVTEAIPEATSLLEKAPQAESEKEGVADSIGGAVSGLTGGETKIGNTATSIGQMGGLADAFKSLGMDSDMVGQFVPVVLDYAKEKGGEAVMGLLQSSLM